MPPAKVPARIDGILARVADVAAVFCHNGKSTQCLRWNLADDRIEPGQWIGGRVYSRRCDLSPDGELLVGAFTNYSMKAWNQREERGQPSLRSWTAVSRIPYFSALALWPGDGTYYGGGVWRGNRHLALNTSTESDITAVSTPLKVELLEPRAALIESSFRKRLAVSGWTSLQELEYRPAKGRTDWRLSVKYETTVEGLMEKPFDRGLLQRRIRLDEEVWSVCDLDGQERLSFSMARHRPLLLDIDSRGRLIFGDAGCLWAWADFPNGEPKMIADLNANEFEPVAPPDWAREWPPSTPPEW